jgi:hypothetical protein
MVPETGKGVGVPEKFAGKTGLPDGGEYDPGTLMKFELLITFGA